MRWTETTSEEDARQRSQKLWGIVLTTHPDGSQRGTVPGPEKVDGEFWADAIKTARDDPHRRIAMAKRQLPLPAAFQEIAVALRAIIKQRKREDLPTEYELRELHYWAALKSWSVPYSELLKEPGFNVLESTPYSKLAALDLGYQTLGCDELIGLNKTDRKWMREAWGEPKVHTTAHVLYRELWQEQERRLNAERTNCRNSLLAEIRAIAADKTPARDPAQLEKPTLFASLTRAFGPKR